MLESTFVSLNLEVCVHIYNLHHSSPNSHDFLFKYKACDFTFVL